MFGVYREEDASLSLVMPCYNEEKIIEQVVRAYYYEVISKIENSEFILIDDCSKDNTYNILDKLKYEFPKLKVLKTPFNGGHGKAIRMGYESAGKEYVFQADSDNQFKCKDFWKLYALKDDYDFILGVRKNRQDPLHRLILSKIIRLVNFILFGIWVKDVNCPFRLIKKRLLNELLNSIDREALAPNIMISILAKKRGIKIKEVAVTHYVRETGKISITNWKLINFAFRGFKQLLKFKITRSYF